MILRMFRSSQYCIDIIQCQLVGDLGMRTRPLCIHLPHGHNLFGREICSQIDVKSSQFQFWGSKESFSVFRLLIVSALCVLSPKAIWNMYVSNIFPLHFIMGHSQVLLNLNFRSLTFMASHLTIVNFIRRDFKLLNSVIKTFIIMFITFDWYFIFLSDAIEASANRGKSGNADEQSLTCEDRNLEPSLVEMLDGVIMLYHIAVHKQLSKVRSPVVSKFHKIRSWISYQNRWNIN